MLKNLFLTFLLAITGLPIFTFSNSSFHTNNTNINWNSKKYLKFRSNLSQNYILYGVLKVAIDSKIIFNSENDRCLKDSKMLTAALDKNELWALKVLDASGNPIPSFIYGQNFWVGSRTECERLNNEFRINAINPKNSKLSSQKSKFPVEYVVIFANYTDGQQYTPFGRHTPLLHIGLCMPSSCSKDEIQNYAQEYFVSQKLNIQKMHNLELKVIETRKPKLENFINRSESKIIFYLLFMNIFIVGCFSIFHTTTKNSLLCKISNCFDLNTNLKQLMSTKCSIDSLTSVNSIRFITCFLIMGGHLIFFSTYFVGNGSEMVIASYKVTGQIFFLMPFFVDIFFHIGAMVLVYNFLKNEKQILEINNNGLLKNSIKFLKLLLNRYIRLTPGLLLTMGLSHLTALYLKENSQYYISEEQDLYCKSDFWWRNLLYIQGYFSNDDMCACWVWYLSADMQYYILTLFGLFIYAKGRKFMITLSYIVLLIASIVYSFYISTEENYKFYLENFKKTENTLYINPLTRIIPYLSGIFSGIILNSDKCKEILPTFSSKIWLFCTFLMLSLFSFGMIFRDFIPQVIYSAANSVVRFVFVQIIVGMIIYLNYIGKAGKIGKFISHHVFVHLSKLTYMMYLIEPIVIYLYRGNSEKPYNFSIFNVYVEFFGILFITYILSIFCTLFFEIPYVKLSNVFLMKRKN